MVSYEIPLGIAIIIGVMTAGTLNLVQLGHIQSGGIHTWLIYRVRYSFIMAQPMKMCHWNFQNCSIIKCLKPSNMWNYINMTETTIISRIISALPCKGR